MAETLPLLGCSFSYISACNQAELFKFEKYDNRINTRRESHQLSHSLLCQLNIHNP